MCCIFTICGWIVDLIQRIWTFSMSCIIMSAVSCVMMTTSMAGIALGYNYSLAEYMDLKETNVSVYLKRGVFDDEIADDMDWRRAGHLPIAGQLRDDNLMTGAPDDGGSTTLRSGRRLDDSVFEAEDQHKYEGSLMKLTAKPLHLDTPGPQITDDLEMAESITKHPMGSLNQLKAIQSLIDSRRAMATGGTTLSPLATYASAGPILPFLPSINNPNDPRNSEIQYRRMMTPGSNFRPYNNMEPGSARSQPIQELNPARFAVPDPASLQSRVDWVAPKSGGIFIHSALPEFFISSLTYPPPITVRPLTVRPTRPPASEIHRDADSFSFPYDFSPKRPSPTYPPYMQTDQELMDKRPDFYNEKAFLEGEEMSKNENIGMPKMVMKTPEEEYEDEIKGLPVRKRRSIIINTLVRDGKKPTERNISQPVSTKSTRNNDNLSSVKNIFTTTIRTTRNDMGKNSENNFTIDKNHSVVGEMNDSQIGTKIFNKKNTNKLVDIKEKRKSNVVSNFKKLNLKNQVKIIRKFDPRENKKQKSSLDRFVTLLGRKRASRVAGTMPEATVTKSVVKKIRIKKRRKSFERKIVSRKHLPNNAATRVKREQPFSNQDILNSISVGLNEAGLLKNPTSSTLVKLLQATLIA